VTEARIFPSGLIRARGSAVSRRSAKRTTSSLARLSTARARAQALTAQISAASGYVALCRAAGIPVRDIAFLLGIPRSE
jgi:hypothetical protein